MFSKVAGSMKKPPKKLAKSCDLFSNMMSAGGGSKTGTKGGGAKKLPVPKKVSEASKKHKKSESQSETDNKPAKKKAKKVEESDSDGDMFEDAGPPGPPRAKAGQ